MIKFKRYPYRVGETYGLNGGLTQRQITMAINKPVRQAKKLQAKAPLLAELLEEKPLQDFDPEAEYNRRQAKMDRETQSTRNFHAEMWRKARKRFFELDEETQAKVIKEWESLTVYPSVKMPATSVGFAGIVDRVSGDQAKRLSKCEAEKQAIIARLRAEREKQLDIFGDVA